MIHLVPEHVPPVGAIGEMLLEFNLYQAGRIPVRSYCKPDRFPGALVDPACVWIRNLAPGYSDLHAINRDEIYDMLAKTDPPGPFHVAGDTLVRPAAFRVDYALRRLGAGNETAVAVSLEERF